MTDVFAKARERFLRALEPGNAHTEQEAMLRRCLEPNADTAFGRQHGFASLRSMNEYRAAVPIRHYDELDPWIDRIVAGEQGVLTAEAPTHFWKTTGTTSTSKRIPVTPAFQAATFEGVAALIGTQASMYPEVLGRPDTTLKLHISPKSIKEMLGGKYPYTSTTEAPLEFWGGKDNPMTPPWERHLQDVVEDDAERLYFLMCFAAVHDLRAIVCLHPSRFQTVLTALAQHQGRLFDELRAGTVLGTSLREPRPDIADRLARIADREGRLLPKDLWPNLSFVSSWSGSYIDRYRPLMTEAFSDKFFPAPSMSSECMMTNVIDGNMLGQPLNVIGAVFEFVPAGEVVKADSKTLLFDQLERGQTYEIIFTTLNGLYRYAMCDIFRVIDFVGDVPRLEYIGRRAVADLTGEKLAEEQATDVLSRVLAGTPWQRAAHTLCAIQSDDDAVRPHYVLVAELEAEPPAEVTTEVARRLDDGFKAVNSRYQLKRNFSDLGPLRIVTVPGGTFARYREQSIRRGMPAGQIKDRILHAAGNTVLAELVALARNA